MSAVSVVATVEPSTTPPRVRLDVTDTGSPAVFSTVVTRLNPDGTTVPVRTFDGNPLALTTSGATRVGLLYDYEAPYGAAVSYSTLTTPLNVSTPVTVPETRVWLIHPGVPAISIPLSFLPGTLLDESHPTQQGVFYPMGRKFPVIIDDGERKAPSSSLNVLTESLIQLAAVKAIVADVSALLLNIPVGLNLGVDTCYIKVGEVKYARMTDLVIDASRAISLPFTVVDRPVGGSQAERTYVDLLDFAAYNPDLPAAYVDYAALLAGP